MNSPDMEHFNANFARSLELKGKHLIEVTFPNGESGWFLLDRVRQVSKGGPTGHTPYGVLDKAVCIRAMERFRVKPAEED
ncbi:hypothetical protein JXD38_06125 [candidate division WOR-3 bacterium]|nr:hypothetical protein [candidate division WOR-3 bacterium]